MSDLSDGIVAVAAIANVIVVGGLAVITKRYADETKRIAEATINQATASREMVSLAIRPAMSVYLLEANIGVPVNPYDLYYKNMGSGPALNITAEIQKDAGDWEQLFARVNMSPADAETRERVTMDPVPERVSLRLTYQDISARSWRAEIELVKVGGKLQNGTSTLQEV